MKRSNQDSSKAIPKKPQHAKAAKPAAEEQEPTPEIEQPAEALRRHVFERPDGFYWLEPHAGEEHGPFTTHAEADDDMVSGGAAVSAESDTLQEAESEVGISEWIDPDTGGPAEDSVPRIEEH